MRRRAAGSTPAWRRDRGWGPGPRRVAGRAPDIVRRKVLGTFTTLLLQQVAELHAAGSGAAVDVTPSLHLRPWDLPLPAGPKLELRCSGLTLRAAGTVSEQPRSAGKGRAGGTKIPSVPPSCVENGAVLDEERHNVRVLVRSCQL